jgi:hypothetical protein
LTRSIGSPGQNHSEMTSSSYASRSTGPLRGGARRPLNRETARSNAPQGEVHGAAFPAEARPEGLEDGLDAAKRLPHLVRGGRIVAGMVAVIRKARGHRALLRSGTDADVHVHRDELVEERLVETQTGRGVRANVRTCSSLSRMTSW